MVAVYFSIFQAGILHLAQAQKHHLFRSHLEALLFREFQTMNVSPQKVVTSAVLLLIFSDLMPCSTPEREGHSLIFSNNLKNPIFFL
jgi:hypothetical protein